MAFHSEYHKVYGTIWLITLLLDLTTKIESIAAEPWQ